MSKCIHLAQFKQPQEQSEAERRGNVQVVYVNHFTAYVAIEPLLGREQLAAQQMRADLTHKVTMQVDSRLTHRHIFTWNTRTFNMGPHVGEDGERGFFVSFYAAEIRG